MTTPRTLEAKVGDAIAAFAALREEVTPPAFRALISKMTETSLRSDPSIEEVQAYAALVQSSMVLARLVAANDRAALIAAAMITQSGVSRPVISTDEDA